MEQFNERIRRVIDSYKASMSKCLRAIMRVVMICLILITYAMEINGCSETAMAQFVFVSITLYTILFVILMIATWRETKNMNETLKNSLLEISCIVVIVFVYIQLFSMI